MKTEDFEILKDIIQKEGFEFHVTDMDKDHIAMIIQKKENEKVEIENFDWFWDEKEGKKIFRYMAIIVNDTKDRTYDTLPQYISNKLQKFLNKNK